MTTYNDTFDRTTTTSIGTASGGWSWTEGSPKFYCDGSVALGVGGANPEAFTPALASSDATVTADFIMSGGSAHLWGRSDGTVNNAYKFVWLAFANLYRIYSLVGGSATQIGSVSGAGSGTKTIIGSCNGSSIQMTVAGVLEIDLTDTSVASGAYAGMGDTSGTPSFDNFTAADIGGGGGGPVIPVFMAQYRQRWS